MKARKSARHLGPAHELRVIELCDPELIPDEERFVDPLDSRFQQQSAYLHECPRCRAVTTITGSDPYCTECNWDSLTDVCEGYGRWAA